MKAINCFNYFILIIISLFMTQAIYADELGRLFTSSTERMALNKIRNEKLKSEKIVTEVVIEIENFVEPIVEEEIVIHDAILLKGIVHRTDGKNAAWINETNTFEGNLESQFIQVPDSNIKSDQVTIVMPDNSTEIDLKVGEVFAPGPQESDVIEAENN